MPKKQIAILAALTLAALTSAAQDLRWPMRTTETIASPAGRGGRGRGAPMMQNPAPEQTRERMATVLVKMGKVTIDDNAVISFKPTPPRGKTSSDVTQATIPFADKEKLVEALKESISDLKKPTKANESESKKIYSDAAGKFTAVTIRDGHKKHLEVTLRDAAAPKDGAGPSVFEVPIQQVEFFYNALRNIK